MRTLAGSLIAMLFFPIFVSADSINNCPLLTKTLSYGSRGAEVIKLQQFLIAQKLLATDSATGFFGKGTQAAVQKFQKQNGIVSSGTPASTGYGSVGKKTRASIASSCAKPKTPPPPAVSVLPPPSYAQGGYGGGTPPPSYAQSSYVTPPSPPSSCTPLAPETRTQQCPAGQSGSITQQRTSSCPGPAWSEWVTTGNTCAPVVDNTPTIQPSTVPTKTLSAHGGNSVLIDYLIQDVCVNSSDQPIPGDPAVCPRHRDLRFGEFTPYIRTSLYLSPRKVWNASLNYPTQALDGSLLVMKTYDYGNNTPVNGVSTAYRDFESYYPPYFEGFDLQEANGEYSSIISTQINTYQPMWRPGCQHDDAWMIYPMRDSTPSAGKTRSQTGISPQCATSFVEVDNYWDTRPTPYTFQSGKTLDALYSYQLDVDAAGNHYPGSHVEAYYWTKEYGGVRWEAWFPLSDTSLSDAVAADARAKCSNAPDTKVFGGTTMRLGACEDWSNYIPLSVPYNPLTSPNDVNTTLSVNLLRFGDFAGAQVGTWQHWDNEGQPTSWAFGKDEDYNSYLKFACWSGCNGNGIYQDADSSALTGKKLMRFGAILKANKTADVTVALFFLGFDGALLGQTVLPAATVGTQWQHVDGTYEWDFSVKPAAKIRFQIYISDKTVEYAADEAYLTPSI